MLTRAEVERFVMALTGLDAAVDDAERIAQLSALEAVKGAVAAAQARVSVELWASRVAADAARGVPLEHRGDGVAEEIALARHESPSRGATHLGLARALVVDLPQTMAHLAAGRISEWAATMVHQATVVLEPGDRRTVDARLAADLPLLSDAQAGAAARGAAHVVDPASAVRRVRAAMAERRVTMRPAPDCMAQVTAFLPAAQGMAVYSALSAAADSVRAGGGDDRSRGQVMADTLVERITGQKQASDVPVTVNVVMSEASLVAGHDGAGRLQGYGPVPVAVLAQLTRSGKAALRRLYTAPTTGRLVAMDSQARAFPAGLAELIALRDQDCAIPFCGAPVRHTDHSVAHRLGGATSFANGQGMCERHNHVKELPGWRTTRLSTHSVSVTTPSGHRYDATAPPPLGWGTRSADEVYSPSEQRCLRLLS